MPTTLFCFWPLRLARWENDIDAMWPTHPISPLTIRSIRIKALGGLIRATSATSSCRFRFDSAGFYNHHHSGTTSEGLISFHWEIDLRVGASVSYASGFRSDYPAVQLSLIELSFEMQFVQQLNECSTWANVYDMSYYSWQGKSRSL